jgi:SAM-dependent methyltransferase
MQSRHESDYLQAALAPANDSGDEISKPQVAIPGVLNIGSGKDWKEEAVNLDVEAEWGPDVLFDLNQPLPPTGVEVTSARFGKMILREDSFDLIHAYDVLEHIAKLSTAMTTCLALLKVGGVFSLNVPYDLSWGAWQDPTHVRAFNERSWLYYTDWFWYLGWNRWRFDLIQLDYVLSPVGQKLQGEGIKLEELTRTPRAVDSMRVQLRKRFLTSDELLILKARRPRSLSASKS